jgi:hypothetical protein
MPKQPGFLLKTIGYDNNFGMKIQQKKQGRGQQARPSLLLENS